MSKIRPEYYVNLKGRQYPTYPGVLIAAHEAGLIGLETDVLQYPAEENQWTAVVRATVTLRDESGQERIFSDIGDCSPKNTTPLIALASLRMASTRAKGRAMRDSIALGETLAEEMPDEEQAQTVAGNGSARRPAVVPDQSAEPAPLSPGADIAVKHGPVCVVCEEPLKPSTYRAAMSHFGRGLCETHGRAERDRLRAEAETAAAS